MITPEITELIRIVQQHYGKNLNTTTDFDEFSLYLERSRVGAVSSSTLKRLWGYVRGSHTPRISTLDVLAQFVGHATFDDFVEWLKTSPVYNSSFFTADHITASHLAPGEMVEISWTPNRRVRLAYRGESTFEVVESVNSKLCEGDRFVTGCFIKGQPLYLPYIMRSGEHTPAFIAGRNGGLSHITIIKPANQQ